MEPCTPHTAGACSWAHAWGYAGRPVFVEQLVFACNGGGEQHAKHAACRHMAGQGSAGLTLPRRLEPISRVLAAERLACDARRDGGTGCTPRRRPLRAPRRSPPGSASLWIF